MEAYQRIVLASRPVAAPTLDTFRLETGAMPRPAAGPALGAHPISLIGPVHARPDGFPRPPTLSQWRSETPWREKQSRRSCNPESDEFREGDIVRTMVGWRSHAAINAEDARQVRKPKRSRHGVSRCSWHAWILPGMWALKVYWSTENRERP